jgi:hypothetical protein
MKIKHSPENEFSGWYAKPVRAASLWEKQAKDVEIPQVSAFFPTGAQTGTHFPYQHRNEFRCGCCRARVELIPEVIS